MTRNQVFTHVKQVCVVVSDLDAAVRSYYDDYGIGPWHLFRYEDVEGVVGGERVKFSVRVALTRVDDRFEWELIQPLDDRSAYSAFLRERGEGVHHVAVDVPDVRRSRLGRRRVKGTPGCTADYSDTRCSRRPRISA